MIVSPGVSKRPHPISGWIEAGLFLFAIAILSVVYVIGHRIGAHPIALVLYGTAASALYLLLIAGPGRDAGRIILAPQSWLIGAGVIGMEVFYCILLEHVSPAHGSLFVRFAIPLSLIAGWVLFARRPRRLAFIGGGIVCLAIIPLMLQVPPGHRAAAALSAIGCALAFNLRSFSAEFHPWNRAAETVMEKLRITGLVVLVTSAASLVLAVSYNALVAMQVVAPSVVVPSLTQMMHGPTFLLGVVFLAMILTSMAVLSFSCVVKITTENFAATTAFTPVATLLVQSAAVSVGLIPGYSFDPGLLPGILAVIAGVFLILYAARRR